MIKYASEKEFGQEVVKYLRYLGYETWQEVNVNRSGKTIDIIAKIRKFYIAIELKLRLNENVLIQAVENKRFVDYSLVIVPKGELSHIKHFYAKNHGIGVISIDHSGYDMFQQAERFENNWRGFIFPYKYDPKTYNKHIRLMPKRITRCKRNKRFNIENYLLDEQKECVAGDVAGNVITPFKRSCKLIYEYLQQYPNATKKEVWKILNSKLHWSSYNSMYSSFNNYSDVDCVKVIKWRK